MLKKFQSLNWNGITELTAVIHPMTQLNERQISAVNRTTVSRNRNQSPLFYQLFPKIQVLGFSKLAFTMWLYNTINLLCLEILQLVVQQQACIIVVQKLTNPEEKLLQSSSHYIYLDSKLTKMRIFLPKTNHTNLVKIFSQCS